MSVDIIERVLQAGGRDRSLGAGEYLFHMGERVAALHFVRRGEVHLIRHHEDGGTVVLQRAGQGDILAEASLFSDRYHCAALVPKAAVVRIIRKREILERIRTEPDFAEAWAAHLAREIQNTRFRSEMLSLRTVASRLDAWLAWRGALAPKGEWKQFAQELGVSPEALYREIAKRRTSSGAD